MTQRTCRIVCSKLSITGPGSFLFACMYGFSYGEAEEHFGLQDLGVMACDSKNAGEDNHCSRGSAEQKLE